MDLARLALFDTVLYVRLSPLLSHALVWSGRLTSPRGRQQIDDSGSMAFEENGSRIDDAKLIIGRVAQAASLFDTDGIRSVTRSLSCLPPFRAKPGSDEKECSSSFPAVSTS